MYEKLFILQQKKPAEDFNQQSYWKKGEIAIIPMKCSVGYTKVFYQVIFRNAYKPEKNFQGFIIKDLLILILRKLFINS